MKRKTRDRLKRENLELERVVNLMVKKAPSSKTQGRVKIERAISCLHRIQSETLLGLLTLIAVVRINAWVFGGWRESAIAKDSLFPVLTFSLLFSP